MTSSVDRSGPLQWLLPRGLIILLGVAGAVVAVMGMRALADVLGPVLLALMLTVAVHPLLGWLRRRGWPSWLAVTATLLSVFVIVLGLAASLALSLAQLATLLPAYQDRFAALVDQATAGLAGLGVGADQVQAALDRVDFGAVAGLVGGLLAGLAGALSNLVFILAVLLFMGLEAGTFPSRLGSVARERPEVVSALITFARGTRSYLVVSTVFGLIVAVIDAGALWVMGIPLPLLWGLLAFITNYIPNIGFVIGLAPPALLGLLEGGPRLMLLVIVVYSVINFVIQSVIQPKYVSDAVDLSLTLTFLSLVFWSWVIGPLGALLAVPLTLLTKALLLDVDPSTRWLSHLITSGPSNTSRQEAPPAEGPPAEGPPAEGAPAEGAAPPREPAPGDVDAAPDSTTR